MNMAEYLDIAVIGGGHAGCEAALAAARMGNNVTMFAISLDSVALMPCNPSIGGTSKGHLVREIDALGGEMGKIIDRTYIQSKMLNTGKGPAVRSLRAQADKARYSAEMRRVLETCGSLSLRQAEVVSIERSGADGRLIIKTDLGAEFSCKAVVLCTGTYLAARCLCGGAVAGCGPSGLRAATKLSGALRGLGIPLMRFKTGTPARIDGRGVDFSKMIPQYGDERVVPFSFENTEENIRREQIPCHLTYTNSETHRVIRENLHLSPMYSGVIEGTGARYCPSIEDKVVRFADKERHQIFIEPEGESTVEMYVQGMSSSLPEDVQIKAYRTVAGLERAAFMRAAYAIEYDCIDATRLDLSLQFKDIPGLFSAGQINGSSGYEEAAAQGLVAGINAAFYVSGKAPLIIDRSEGYIGVLIDDLVTKGTREPYRMMTSRAEYRLLLRQDNADVRLTPKGYDAGLISGARYGRFLEKKRAVEDEIKRISALVAAPGDESARILNAHGSPELTTGTGFPELIKRPELSYEILRGLDGNAPELPSDVAEQVNINIKYEGYISRQARQVEQFKKNEERPLPTGFDYTGMRGLRIEAAQKLNEIRPSNVGQAMRIAGVSPADISVLLIGLRR